MLNDFESRQGIRSSKRAITIGGVFEAKESRKECRLTRCSLAFSSSSTAVQLEPLRKSSGCNLPSISRNHLRRQRTWCSTSETARHIRCFHVKSAGSRAEIRPPLPTRPKPRQRDDPSHPRTHNDGNITRPLLFVS